MTETVRMNGRLEPAEPSSVQHLLALHGLDPATRFLAVAVNGRVVARSRWDATQVQPGDDVEVVRPVQGG
jgi:sulfur carrier protein